LDGDNAATDYLKQQTSPALLEKFRPVIESSLSKVGADKIWNNLT